MSLITLVILYLLAQLMNVCHMLKICYMMSIIG
jgi:hypothetical protein